MDAHTMLKIAAWLFGIAAAGGLVMAAQRFSGRSRPPDALAMLHGLLAAAGLTLLLYAAAFGVLSSLALVSIALFVIAALGGLAINLLFHQRQVALPKPWVIVHAGIAVVAYVTLLLSLRGPGV
jgi:hypothetical protein